jgi:hypothetical protein
MYRLQAFEKVVILVDSKAAIQVVSSNSEKKYIYKSGNGFT